jgi:hypothetical protein
MTYINKFSTNTEYQAFTEGEEYVIPNICYVTELKGLKFKPKVNNGGTDMTALFPCYLTGSTTSGTIDNGEIGIQLYNYLRNKYSDGICSLASDEKIYVNSTIVNKITIYNDDKNIVLGIYVSMDYELTSNGQVYKPKHSGGGIN